MTIENLTYAALAERLKISPEAARALVKRMRLPRQRANDGKTLVSVDLSEIQHKPMPARSSRGDQAVTGTVAILTARIEVLQAQLAMLEESSRGHREDYVRECERADRLVTELIKMTSDMMEAKETAAKLEGELAALRSIPKGEPLTWWRWRTTGRPMNALMTTGVTTAVRSVPVTVRQWLDQMARNLTTACASLATALREVRDDRFWDPPTGSR